MSFLVHQPTTARGVSPTALSKLTVNSPCRPECPMLTPYERSVGTRWIRQPAAGQVSGGITLQKSQCRSLELDHLVKTSLNSLSSTSGGPNPAKNCICSSWLCLAFNIRLPPHCAGHWGSSDCGRDPDTRRGDASPQAKGAKCSQSASAYACL